MRKKVEDYLKEKVIIDGYKRSRKWLIRDPLAICYSHKQIKQFENTTIPDRLFLFREVLATMIQSKFKMFTDKTSSNKIESKILDEIEKSLLGTPHFLDPLDFKNENKKKSSF